MVRVRPSERRKIGLRNKDWHYEYMLFEWRREVGAKGAGWYPIWSTDYNDPCFKNHIKGEKLATELGIARLKRAIQDRDGEISFEKWQTENTKQFTEDNIAEDLTKFKYGGNKKIG